MESVISPTAGLEDAVLACPCGAAWHPRRRCSKCGTTLPASNDIPLLMAETQTRDAQLRSFDVGLLQRRSYRQESATQAARTSRDGSWHWSRFVGRGLHGPVAVLDSERGQAALELAPPGQRYVVGFTDLTSAHWGKTLLSAHSPAPDHCFVFHCRQLPFLPRSLGLLIVRYPQRLNWQPQHLWTQMVEALRPGGHLYLEGISPGHFPALSLATQRQQLLESTRQLAGLGMQVTGRWAKAPTLQSPEFRVDLRDPDACRYAAGQLAPLHWLRWPSLFPRLFLSRKGMGLVLLMQKDSR